MTANSEFVMGTELECLTARPDNPDALSSAMPAFFRSFEKQSPSLPGDGGVFNGYGRTYVDCGHIELAIAECDSPYILSSVVERQMMLAARAVAELRERGIELLLANNNHSGLLNSNCPIWGAHENYMVEWHPEYFTDLILPFLVTRIYGGAGGILFPSGRFLAAVRPVRMELATGGSTTGSRAIHSTSREEPLTERRDRHRYHLILGDGHRSQFNLALQFGATALTLKAIHYNVALHRRIRRLPLAAERDWVAALRRFNTLQTPSRPLSVDPIIIETQRLYLEGARQYADSLRNPPPWIDRTLQDWDDTLSALQRLDRPWLAARLDTFAKYELYSSVLAEAGLDWSRLPRNRRMFEELAVLDHSYHSFCEEDSVFTMLEQQGLLQHRVTDLIAPGAEPEAFVPEVATRAATRARFIKEHAMNRSEYLMSWTWVNDMNNGCFKQLSDPFATSFTSWTETQRPSRSWRDLMPF